MGYYENTSYLKVADLKIVEEALDQLFAEEDMQRVEAPPTRERFDYEPMQYAGALENDLWGIALFPGSDPWTVIKTAPLELLAERLDGNVAGRFSRLCRMLDTVGFQLHVYDGASTLLCEVSENGETAISGFGDMNSEDPTIWKGETLSEDLYESRFQTLPYQDRLAVSSHVDDFAARIAHEFGGLNASHCDNLTSVGPLIRHTPLEIEGGFAAYYRWPGPSRVRAAASSWAEYLPTSTKAPTRRCTESLTRSESNYP